MQPQFIALSETAMHPVARAILLLCAPAMAFAQSGAAPEGNDVLPTVTVEASADASAQGLVKPFAGGQVTRGGRVGVLGNQDAMATPFSTTGYTQELIQNQQAQSVADVLLNDAGIRAARGLGNFQELYVVRGFPLYSDDIAYNGLYGMLPRQYVASEFFERVEVLRGANAFLNGAAPGGSALGGGINLLPKRAANAPLTSVTAGMQTGGQGFVALDLARRFGPDDSTGVRLNAVRRDGGTGVDREKRQLSALGLGLDWRSRAVRVSADFGFQDHQLSQGRPNVNPAAGLPLPAAPDARRNYAQDWTHSKERDTFGTVRAEFDVNDAVTVWAAGGLRQGKEDNAISELSLTNTQADSLGIRFDNARKDKVFTGEVGVRGRFKTGGIGHEMVASLAGYKGDERNAYGMTPSVVANNLYHPFLSAEPNVPYQWSGGNLASPGLVNRVQTTSFAVADTMSWMDDRLRVTLGLRHQRIKQTGYDYNSGAETGGYSKSRVTPVAGVVFKITPQVSAYANYIEGLVKGDTAPTTANNLPVLNAGAVLSPFRTKQQEVGAKFDIGTLGGSVSVFQLSKPVAMVSNQTYAPNGKQQHQGMELSLYGQATKRVRVLGGLTWLDAKQVRTPGGATDGKKAVGVPEYLVNAGVEWDVAAVPGFSVNARVMYTGKQWADATNAYSVPSWTRTDLGVRYLVDLGSNRLLTLRARVDNVFNKNYWSSVGGYPGANYLVLGAPRTFALNATVEF